MNKRHRICLGAFAGAHGVKGEIKVKTFTALEDAVAAYGPVESEDGARRFTLTFIRTLKPALALVSAPEIGGREEAAALTGMRLYVDRTRLPDPGADEFYVEDLVGLAALDDGGRALGRIAAVHNFGAGDILEITDAGAKKGGLLVPFTRAAVPTVDLAGGRVVITAAALAEIEVAERDPEA